MTDFHVLLVVCWIVTLALLSYLFNKYLRMKQHTSEMDSMLYEEGRNLMKFVMRQAYIIDTRPLSDSLTYGTGLFTWLCCQLGQ